MASSEYIGKGIIELEFSEKLTPYLLQLKEQFTRYQLENVLNLQNKHSIRIYELLKQYEKVGKRKFQIEKLKQILMLEGQYKRFYDFERFVLKIASDEINKYTDLTVKYEKIKKGRNIDSILFKIKSKDTEEKIYI